MLAFASGKVEAFDELYSRYRQPLYQFVVHGCGDEVAAAELFQEVWESVIQARHNFEPRGTFKSWVYRIARNRLVDHYRAVSRRVTTSFDENETEHVTTLETPLSPEELTDIASRRGLVHRALERLPVAQRDAVMLKTIAGFSLAEIAHQQGDPVETVKSRLRYGYTRLRQQLRNLA